jgi:DNA-binding NarL/FixJ family response regulator
MAGPRIFVCHRMMLLSECLARALDEPQSNATYVLDPLRPLGSLLEVTRGSVNGRSTQTEALILDPMIDHNEAVQLVDWLRASSSSSKLILIVSRAAAARLVDLAHFDSDGCVLDEAPLAEARHGIRAVISGQPYCSPQLASDLFAQVRRNDGGGSLHFDADCELTNREREILRLIAWEQLANKEIARRLHVSLYTIKNHVHNIIEKLKVADRHQAADVANRRRLLGSRTSAF